MAACTKADCALFDSLHGPMPGSVAVSWYGVANPAALSAFFGTISVQLAFGVAGGAGGCRPAAVAAALCICALRRSVLAGSVCANAAGERTDSVPINTASRPIPVRTHDWFIVRTLLLV